MKEPGIIVKLSDDRLVIVYNNQPLLKEKGKIISALVDEEFNQILDESGKPKIIIKNVEVHNEEMQAATLIGYVD